MKYINIKKLIAIISAGFILVSIGGCQKKEEANKSDSLETENYQYVETKSLDENNISSNVTMGKTQISSNTSVEDEIIIYFENLEEEVNYYINEDNFEKMKEKAKNIAVTGIDFIFYGTEIKGVTFEELTTATKEKILSIMASIDSKIESKFPSYKETIENKFGKGYDYVSTKIQDGLTYIDGKLDEKYGDDYQETKDKVNEIQDSIKEESLNIYDKVAEKLNDGFTKIKEWYENNTGK